MKDKMMKRFMLWLLWTIIAVAFGYYWHYEAKAYQKCLDAVQPAGWVACDRVEAALDFHGIGFAESDENGNLTFERDGQTCQLFTKAFLKSWEKIND